ncbi:MAG: SurA N-terminal domain-containing protein, partial [Muribaculum sp.]|nr:SurA N-terminal domain-containing protein [Muribaculum sp.]
MATLEKIRKRSTLLLIVVGAALLAFIIGDFFTSGRTLFGNGMTVAKVGNTSIDIQDFQRRVEQATQQQQQQNSRQNNDAAKLQNDVLNAMIQEVLLDRELEALGIEVTDFELQSFMLGANAHPAMYQFAARFGVQTPDQLYDIAFNPVKYDIPAEQAEQVKTLWLEQEKTMEREIKLGKLQSLIGGAIAANELDAKGFYDENAIAKTVAYVAYPYNLIPNDSINVTDADRKATYNTYKDMFKNDQEMRRVSFISVVIEPSAADREEAQALVDTTIAQLAQLPELEAVNGSTEFNVNRQSARLSQINNILVSKFVEEAQVGDVKNISSANNTYTIGKLLEKKQAVDSVNIDVVAYQGDAAGRDSVFTALTSGKSLDEVAKKPGVAGVQPDIWQTVAAAPDSEIKDRILTAPIGQYVYLDSAAGNAQFVRVNTRTAPVTLYDFALITYKVYPSDQTVADLRANLEQFAATVPVADSLKANDAMLLGYSPMPGSLTADSYGLPGVPASRNAVKWAFNAKPGDVSPVLDNANNDRYLFVTLRDIIKPGYVPMSTDYVTNYVEGVTTAEKKAA